MLTLAPAERDALDRVLAAIERRQGVALVARICERANGARVVVEEAPNGGYRQYSVAMGFPTSRVAGAEEVDRA